MSNHDSIIRRIYQTPQSQVSVTQLVAVIGKMDMNRKRVPFHYNSNERVHSADTDVNVVVQTLKSYSSSIEDADIPF